jgi:hypothetical protein
MMAKLDKRCVICGTTKGVRLWTIDNLYKVVATYLCKEDAVPLTKIMDAAGDFPLRKQVPVPDRPLGPEGLDIHKHGRREVPMEALDWTPPSEPELHKDKEPKVPDDFR